MTTSFDNLSQILAFSSYPYPFVIDNEFSSREPTELFFSPFICKNSETKHNVNKMVMDSTLQVFMININDVILLQYLNSTATHLFLLNTGSY